MTPNLVEPATNRYMKTIEAEMASCLLGSRFIILRERHMYVQLRLRRFQCSEGRDVERVWWVQTLDAVQQEKAKSAFRGAGLFYITPFVSPTPIRHSGKGLNVKYRTSVAKRGSARGGRCDKRLRESCC